VTAAAFDTDRSIDSLTAAGMPEAQAQALTALLKNSMIWT